MMEQSRKKMLKSNWEMPTIQGSGREIQPLSPGGDSWMDLFDVWDRDGKRKSVMETPEPKAMLLAALL